MIHVAGEPTRSWTDQDRETLADLAQLGVIELELRAEHSMALQSEAELHYRTRLAELRSEISARMTQNAPLNSILQGCAELLQEGLDVAFLRIWTLERHAEELQLRASAGMYTHLDGDHSRIRIGQFKIGWIAEHRKAHLTNTIETDPMISDQAWAKQEGMTAFAGYPLVVDDRLVGVMATFSRGKLGGAILEIMASVADDLAQCIERKQAEAGRLAIEARQTAIVQSALDCIITIDHEGRVLEFNPAAERTFGYARQEVLGQSLSELIVPPALRQAHRDGLKRFLATGQGRVLGRRVEIDAMRSDGSIFPIELAINVVPQTGNPVFTAYGRDITERHRFEKDLKESNGLLESIRRILSRYIASDWQSNDVFAETLETILEFSGSQYGFIGEVLSDGSQPYLKTHAITDISWDEDSRRFFQEHAPNGLEFRNLKSLFGRVITEGLPVISNEPDKDPRRGGLPPGHPALESFLGLPVLRAGELVGMIGIANRPGGYDETLVERLQPLVSTYAGLIEAYRVDLRRRRAEASLRLTQFSIDRAGDSVFWLDRSGGFLYVNDQACKSLGYSREELLGMSVFDIMPPTEASHFRKGWDVHWEDLRNLGSFTFRSTQARKDGSEFPVELTVNYLASEGKEINCTFARDVTAHERAAIELRKARDAAEEASRAKSEFLANMSHEVRTPMAAVLGFGDMLLAPGLPPAERDRALQGIRSNGAHLLQIIDDILDLSKIEAGKFELSLIPTDPRQVVHEVHSLLRGRASEKQIVLQAEIVEPLPTRIRTDPVRLRQILVNFTSNAIKFTPSGQKVGIRLFVDSSTQNQTTLCYEVTDEGIGMDRRQLARLFRPFEQVDSTASRRHGGTGLGLSISKHLAEALGGRIEVQSDPGRGSQFMVRFPIPAITSSDFTGPHEDDSPLPTPAPSKLTGSVLVAEDNPSIQLILHYHLTSMGLKVEIVENGRQAVDRARSGEFDVILMDMQMPELDGYGATSSLRQDGYRGPIIALTAHALREDRDRCLRSGCTDYLAKPINAQTLATTLARYLPAQTSQMPDRSPTNEGTTTGDQPFELLVHAYLSALQEQRLQLRALLDSGDYDPIRGLAHRTRGVAAMYGFPDLGEIAGLVEDAFVERRESELINELVYEFLSSIETILDTTHG
ncbi:PAS domain S-box protein [Tautonia rosea]|uniref:PAS domain S-box protein n=1 Tax=Tautonia rosea TaxID=2728037 RepID=UPI001475AD62|nr:PAS domain S-box protein [Tautonia rosea]